MFFLKVDSTGTPTQYVRPAFKETIDLLTQSRSKTIE